VHFFFDETNPGNNGTTGAIFNILKNIRKVENLGNDVRYIALFPREAMQTEYTGMAQGLLTAVPSLDQTTMAHELGHTCSGVEHVPGCGDPSEPNENYPQYGKYHRASIGEYGFDIQRGRVRDPHFARDFMSYCPDYWISPFHYERLMNCIGSPPEGKSGGFSPVDTEGLMTKELDITSQSIVDEIQEYLYLSLQIYRDGCVTLDHPSQHLDGYPIPSTGDKTPYFVELHDPEGRILASRRLYNATPYLENDDAVLPFFISLRWHSQADRIVVKKENEILDTFDIEEDAPEIQELSINEETSEELVITWDVEEDEDSFYTLRFSNDGGENWIFIASGINDGRYTVNTSRLPSGDECFFQVVASSGFRSSLTTSEAFSLPESEMNVSIISPEDGNQFELGETILLFGVAYSADGYVDPEDLSWSSNVDGSLGRGSRLLSHTLSEGSHVIKLETNNIEIETINTSVTIRVKKTEE
jgi:hypothetical protein